MLENFFGTKPSKPEPLTKEMKESRDLIRIKKALKEDLTDEDRETLQRTLREINIETQSADKFSNDLKNEYNRLKVFYKNKLNALLDLLTRQSEKSDELQDNTDDSFDALEKIITDLVGLYNEMDEKGNSNSLFKTFLFNTAEGKDLLDRLNNGIDQGEGLQQRIQNYNMPIDEGSELSEHSDDNSPFDDPNLFSAMNDAIDNENISDDSLTPPSTPELTSDDEEPLDDAMSYDSEAIYSSDDESQDDFMSDHEKDLPDMNSSYNDPMPPVQPPVSKPLTFFAFGSSEGEFNANEAQSDLLAGINLTKTEINDVKTLEDLRDKDNGMVRVSNLTGLKYHVYREDTAELKAAIFKSDNEEKLNNTEKDVQKLLNLTFIEATLAVLTNSDDIITFSGENHEAVFAGYKIAKLLDPQREIDALPEDFVTNEQQDRVNTLIDEWKSKFGVVDIMQTCREQRRQLEDDDLMPKTSNMPGIGCC